MLVVPFSLALFGAACLFVEVVTGIANSEYASELPKPQSKVYFWCSLVVGLILALGSLYPEYSLGPHVRVAGVPFATVILKFERGHWIDFVSPLIFPALVGNAFLAALFSQVLVFATRKLRRPRASDGRVTAP